jgi:hypothetical protein
MYFTDKTRKKKRTTALLVPRATANDGRSRYFRPASSRTFSTTAAGVA